MKVDEFSVHKFEMHCVAEDLSAVCHPGAGTLPGDHHLKVAPHPPLFYFSGGGDGGRGTGDEVASISRVFLSFSAA